MKKLLFFCLFSASFSASAQQNCEELTKPLLKHLEKLIEAKQTSQAEELAARIVTIGAVCGLENAEFQTAKDAIERQIQEKLIVEQMQKK